MLQNACLLVKIDADTADREPIFAKKFIHFWQISSKELRTFARRARRRQPAGRRLEGRDPQPGVAKGATLAELATACHGVT